MTDYRRFRKPDFRHVFTLTDGEVIIVPHRQAQRVIQFRNPRSPKPEVAWEIQQNNGIVRVVWPDEILDWVQEPL